MRLLYHSRNKMIKNRDSFGDYVDLTPTESRLIEILSDEEAHTYEEISNYVFKYSHYDSYNYHTLAVHKYRILKKLEINIKTISNYGLVLKDEIYIT